jgi:AhpD family alkylhydroperoxidase
MARLDPVRPHGLDLLRRLTFFSARRMYGRSLEPSRVIAHHKTLLAGFGAISVASDRLSHAVPEPIKNLAMLRTAQLIGCEWCLDFGSYLARQSGIEEAKLRELSRWREADAFDERERLVLEYADAMTRTPAEVTDELFARLREHFDERQMVELTIAISLENLYSRTNWALGIEGEGFSEGSYCVPPLKTGEPLVETTEAR